MDDEHTLPPSVRLQSPSLVQSGTAHAPLESVITDNMHDGSDTSNTAPTNRLSSQIMHSTKLDELPVNEPVIHAAIHPESSMETQE